MIDLEFFGYIAGVLGVVAWAPQFRKVWVDKRYEGVSIPTLLLVVITLSMWVIYGISLSASAIIWSNIAAITIISSIIIGVIRLQREESVSD
jgi:uncharacterized protein with PQ loop repeat